MRKTFIAEEVIGKTLGPCRLEKILGRGGMSVVYQAYHLRLDKAVAVKVLAGAGDAARLLQEARLAAKLEDPRIVSVHDAGEQDGLAYIVMQLVSGETLEQRVRRAGALAPKEALRVMREVLLGLKAAHALGIVHRDIKPANIMLEPDGGVKIMDFGVSTGLASSGAQDVVGSWDFMPPEQGFGAAPHPTMDLYSFGATYFYALTGLLPYNGSTAAEQMVLHRDAPVPNVRQKRPEATAKAAALLMRLMQKDPQARPASAEEVLREMNSHGMLLEVDASGSPFVLLPPPVPSDEGFLPPPAFPGTQEPAGEDVKISSAPPAEQSLSAGAPRRLPASAACIIAAGALLASWKKAGPLDWAAAAVFAAGAAGGAIWSRQRTLGRRLAGGLCGITAVVLFIFYARSAAMVFSLEAALLAALGLALGAAALSLGLASHRSDRWPATGLLTASTGALLAAAAGSGAEGVGGIWPRFQREMSLFLGLGGGWRWAGLLVITGAWLFLRPKTPLQAERPSGPRVLNWNK